MNKLLSKTKLLTAFLILLTLAFAVFSQNKKVSLNDLTQELQKSTEATDEMTLIWWIPEEFWRASLAESTEITESQKESFLKILRPYIVLAVVDGKIGTMGGVTYKPEATIRNNIQIFDGQGVSYRPLPDNKIDADARNLLGMMKPIVTNLIGQMGQNMHFFLFPSKTEKGQDIINMQKEGTFLAKLDTREFKWRLPLGSLLPQKYCPIDGEKLNGAWKFCPWHGVELKTIKS